MRQCRKLLWVMVVFTIAFTLVEENSTNTGIRSFSFLSLLLNHFETQSSKAKLLLPIMPIVIAAYDFTLLWDNLCPNSCIFTSIL